MPLLTDSSACAISLQGSNDGQSFFDLSEERDVEEWGSETRIYVRFHIQMDYSMEKIKILRLKNDE